MGDDAIFTDFLSSTMSVDVVSFKVDIPSAGNSSFKYLFESSTGTLFSITVSTTDVDKGSVMVVFVSSDIIDNISGGKERTIVASAAEFAVILEAGTSTCGWSVVGTVGNSTDPVSLAKDLFFEGGSPSLFQYTEA